MAGPSLLQFLFEDKRATTFVLLLWMTIACSIFYFLGAFHIHFMTFGPSPKTTFMGMTIDTWTKWNALATFSFTNTAMNEFLGSALGPWFTNTIQDHKTKFLPYSKGTCIIIVQMETIYGHVMSIFGMFLFFSQIDFMLIRTIADLIVQYYTTSLFLSHKAVDPVRYQNDRCGVDQQELDEMLLQRPASKHDGA